MPHFPGEHPFSSCFSSVCISHGLVVNLRFWVGFKDVSLKYTPGWSSSWGTDAKRRGTSIEAFCEKEAVPKNSFFLPGVLSKTSKFFLFISDSSCWEVDAPAIEIAQKKQKASWGAALAWARSYSQVNTQKGRDCWEESGMKEYPHCTTALDEETPYQKAGKQVNTYSFVLHFFHLAMKHFSNGPLPSKRIPLWKKVEEIFTVFFFFFWCQLWHHQLEVSTTQPVLQSEGAEKWVKWKNWQLAWNSSENINQSRLFTVSTEIHFARARKMKWFSGWQRKNSVA